MNKIENYEDALTYFPQEKIQHMPRKIPAEAQNIQLETSTFSSFGSQSIYLIFDIDKNYIENELKKHKYVNKIKYNSIQGSYRFFPKDINLDDFRIYIINDKQHENPNEHSFFYHYGIGVNPQHTRILYYYENPD